MSKKGWYFIKLSEFTKGKSNYTNIEPQHMYIYGNSSYMKACPIAADFA